MSDNMLSQEEIDALLSKTQPRDLDLESERTEEVEPLELTPEEIDALGEIGNISMGTAATTLSQLLGHKVVITSPKVSVDMQEKVFESFKVPYVIIQVEFKTGLQGFNVLVIQLRDAMVLADLMMGGGGSARADQITEMELSAASEAMNQMIGSASTSLSSMFARRISISPPVTTILEVADGVSNFRLPTEDPVVVVSFKMTVDNLLDTEIMQIMGIQTAKEEAGLLLSQLMGAGSPDTMVTDEEIAAAKILEPVDEHVSVDFPVAEAESPREDRVTFSGERSRWAVPDTRLEPRPILSEIEQRKLELLLEIPLKVSVILGRTRRPIKDVLSLTPGAIVELSSLVDDPVEILVNGTLVALGEVVVVNENFGVRITSIISPQERVQQLGGKG